MLAGTAVARESSGPDYGIYAYTAREWDPETNLYYYRARYYDPQVGRFISEDPIGFRAGPNFYSYVDNRPVDETDPLGLFTPTANRIINELCRLYPRGCRSPIPIPPKEPLTCDDRLQQCLVKEIGGRVYMTFMCELVCHRMHIGRGLCALICIRLERPVEEYTHAWVKCRREYQCCLEYEE